MSDRLENLTTLRDLLWDSIRDADPDKRAPLAARLESVFKQIEDLTPKEGAGDPVDEIAQRRAARRASAAKGSHRTKRAK